MPYDTVGNSDSSAADRFNGGGGSGDAPTSSGRSARDRNGAGRGRSGGAPCTCRCICLSTAVVVLFVGVGCTIGGVVKIGMAVKDSRGDLLKQWSSAMNTWQPQAELQFAALKLAVDGGVTPLALSTESITPADFGETSWTTKDIHTPSSVTAAQFKGTAACSGTKLNEKCTIVLADANSAVIATRTITPKTQVGPAPTRDTSQFCSWYDTDYFHPMASVGMGACNAQMAGTSQTYNYGPDKCVEKHYLDTHGCPNDILTTGLVTKWGWNGWATYLDQKPRFTYQDDKCWDYTDCLCDGCGYTFKTDVSKGYGFTGYGYYQGNVWTPFAKPFAAMSTTEKRDQCVQAFGKLGWSCPASKVNLICFRAGGYPKKSCTQYCTEQGAATDSNATYTPQTTCVTVAFPAALARPRRPRLSLSTLARPRPRNDRVDVRCRICFVSIVLFQLFCFNCFVSIIVFARGSTRSHARSHARTLRSHWRTYNARTFDSFRYVTITDYYGPWGHSGQSKSYTTAPAHCDYEQTTTTQITALDIALSADLGSAQSGGSRWVAGASFAESTVVSGTKPFPAGVPTTVSIGVRSAGGPVMVGRTLTNGCGPDTTGASKKNRACFGASQLQNLTEGIALLAAGLVLLCGPAVLICLLCGACVFIINKLRGGSAATQQQYSSMSGVAAYEPPVAAAKPIVAQAYPVV